MLSKKLHDTLYIIGTIATVIGAYFTYKALNNSSSQVVTQEYSTEYQKDISVKGISDRPGDSDSIKPLPEEIDEKCISIEAANKAIQTAEGVISSTKRDEILENLSIRALCIGNADISHNIVKKIISSTRRDSAYIRIIEEMIKSQKFDEASLFTNYIISSTMRDNAKARIIAQMD